MNDSTKRIEPQGHLPRSFDDSGRPLLKADMPLWETPKYLQEDAFPIPKETAPAQLEKERPRPEGPRAGAAKKPPKAPPPPKSPAEKQKPEAKGKKAALHSDTATEGYIRRSSIQSWFNTFMIMNIPIIGWIYLFILALSKKDQRKDFAKAYLVYKLVFLLMALAIIAFFLYAGMEAADLLLQYINML